MDNVGVTGRLLMWRGAALQRDAMLAAPEVKTMSPRTSGVKPDRSPGLRPIVTGAAWSLVPLGSFALVCAPWLPTGQRSLGWLGPSLAALGGASALAATLLSPLVSNLPVRRTGQVRARSGRHRPYGRVALAGSVVMAIALTSAFWRARAELQEGLAGPVPVVLAAAAGAALLGWILVGADSLRAGAAARAETAAGARTAGELDAIAVRTAVPARGRAGRLAGAVLAAALVPAAVVPAALWRVEAAVVNHTTAGRAPVPPVPAAAERVRWTWQAPAPVMAVNAGGPGVIVATRAGVIALDGRTGRERWRYSRDDLTLRDQSGAFAAAVSADGSTVIVNLSVDATYARDLRGVYRTIAFDATTGAELWRSGRAEGSALAASSGAVALWRLGLYEHSLTIRDLRTGRLRWNWRGPDALPADSVTASGDTLLVARRSIGPDHEPEVLTFGRDGAMHGPTRIPPPDSTEWSGHPIGVDPWLLDPAAPGRPELTLFTGDKSDLRRWRIPISADATPGVPVRGPADKFAQAQLWMPHRVMATPGTVAVPTLHESQEADAGPRYRAVRDDGQTVWSLGDSAGPQPRLTDVSAGKLLFSAPLDGDRHSVSTVDRQTGRTDASVTVSVPRKPVPTGDGLNDRLHTIFAPGAVVSFRYEGEASSGWAERPVTDVSTRSRPTPGARVRRSRRPPWACPTPRSAKGCRAR